MAQVVEGLLCEALCSNPSHPHPPAAKKRKRWHQRAGRWWLHRDQWTDSGKIKEVKLMARLGGAHL
jgi:hypothetical protein